MAEPKRLITHSETFHTDDVFATALLLKLFPDAEVVRSRDEVVIATGDIVYDVGRTFDPKLSRFDHHQEGAEKRENGITYSSFGLLWREYGVQYCDGDAEAADLVDTMLVAPIDANDNGQEIVAPKYENLQPFTVDTVVAQMNPLEWVDESESPDSQFHVAVELADRILRRACMAAQDKLRSQRYLLDVYEKAEDKRVIVTEKQANVRGVLEQCPELLYLISPRDNGRWNVLAVPLEADSFESRRPFPKNWRTKTGAELAAASGVSDAVFCHASGFLAVAQSEQGALELARNSLQA